jgi:hypothetical protein
MAEERYANGVREDHVLMDQKGYDWSRPEVGALFELPFPDLMF